MEDLVYVFAQFSWTNVVLIGWKNSLSFRGRTGGKLTGTEVNDRTLARKTGARHDIRKMYMSGAHVQCRTCETLSHLDPCMCLTSQLPTWPDVSTG